MQLKSAGGTEGQWMTRRIREQWWGVEGCRFLVWICQALKEAVSTVGSVKERKPNVVAEVYCSWRIPK